MAEIELLFAVIGSAWLFFAIYYAIGYKFERILRKIAMAGGLSPDSAVKPEEAGIIGEWEKTALKRLVKEGKLAMTEDERYYVVSNSKEKTIKNK